MSGLPGQRARVSPTAFDQCSDADCASGCAGRPGLRVGMGAWHPHTIYSVSVSYMDGVCVTKRLIDLDDELLAAAQLQLQTSGVSDTVRAALRHAAAAAARARQIEWLGEGGLAELAEKEQRDAVWR